MIDQALLRNSSGGDGSHSSHVENPRNMHTARPCYYADFMMCHPLNFKGTEGAVGLTCWIEKMESVFNISGCAVENQVKFATCTLLDATLTRWNSQIRTLGPDAYTMTWSVLKKKMADNQIRTLGPDAYTMTWSVLKKKMTDKYCPLGEDTTPAIVGAMATPTLLIIEVAMGQTPGEMRDCPKLNNKNRGNRNAQGWVYVVGNAERNGNAARNPNSNIVTESYIGRESRLTVISCSKVQKYKAKGCHVFLAQISATKKDDKPERKQVKDVPIVQDFPEVFPEDLPGLPPARLVEFQIDLIPGAAHVARAPYRLAPYEMKELLSPA
nr:putative reverse transcriptase domain-containing protein [Tanacetum cinerariifolium]